jgi:heme/copper-type cytochrome/quinol oxidase subunit 2
MSESTKQALEAFVLQVIEAAKNGATWTAEQTPLLVQEWLRWQLWENALYFAFFIILGISLVFLARYSAKRHQEGQEGQRYYDGSWMVGIILGTIFACLTVILAASFVPSIIKILVAPRVVVFEKFIELVK